MIIEGNFYECLDFSYIDMAVYITFYISSLLIAFYV